MVRSLTIHLAVALVATGLLAVDAAAAVRFDPIAGTGFVGRRDAQAVLSVSDAELRRQAGSLVFTYAGEFALEQTCTHDGTTQVRRRTLELEPGIESRPRYRRQADGRARLVGFVLAGYGGGLPADICPDANPNPGEPQWRPVGPVRITGVSDGVLRVNGVPL